MTQSGYRSDLHGVTTSPAFRYVPGLDGVRALAVLAVLAFHGGMPWAHGGFLGVDVFFVLSGYLITGLLVAEHDRMGRIALGAFWRRRAVRLLPALMLVVCVVVVGARALLPPEDPSRLRGDGLAALFYAANWRMVFRGDDYFSQTASPSPLEHTWSLGIEEQFYLVWPLLLVLLLARSLSATSRRTALGRVLVLCFIGVAVSSLMLSTLYRASDPGRAYYGTDARGASLLVGAWLAVALASRWPTLSAGEMSLRSRPARAALGAVAALAVLGLLWAVTHADGSDGWLYRGGLLAVALGVASVLAHVALVPDGWSAWTLSRAPLVLLGRISYGVYLWHWPVFIAVNAARTGRAGAELFALRCLVTLVVAVLSYVLVERPVRRLASGARPGVTAGVGVAAVTASVVAVALAPTAVGAAQAGGAPPFGAGTRDGIAAVGPAPTEDVRPGAGRHHRSRAAQRHHPRPGREPVVAVFGDSVAWTLVTYLSEHPGLDVRDRTMLGCGVAREGPYRYFGQLYPAVSRDCRDWPRLWRHAIDVDDPDVALILVGRWETMDRQLDGRWGHVGEPAFDAYLRSELELAIRTAGAHGARVLLATEPYNRRGERLDGGLFPEDEPERVTAWNTLLRDVASDHRRVRVVELGERLTPDGEFTWTAGGTQVRSDGVHLTPSGVHDWIAPWLVPQLMAAVTD
jgi:peptidoglycan/LPS O-acetylase OafA/YrhL